MKFANGRHDSEIALIRCGADEYIGIQFDLLCSRFRKLNWFAEFPGSDVDLCARQGKRREVIRSIVICICNQRFRPTFDSFSVFQLFIQFREVVTWCSALTVAGEQLVAARLTRKKKKIFQ